MTKNLYLNIYIYYLIVRIKADIIWQEKLGDHQLNGKDKG